MGCVTLTGGGGSAQTVAAIVCSPTVYLDRRIGHCPTCGRRRRFAVEYAIWYGPTETCCACGDCWMDGYRSPRPAKRGWRKEAVAKARELWERAGNRDRARFRAWVAEQMGWEDGEPVAKRIVLDMQKEEKC